MAVAERSSEAQPRRWRLPERLPDIKGKWLGGYTVIWMAAFLLPIVAPVRGEVEDYQRLNHPWVRRCGLVLNQQHGTTTIAAFFGSESVTGSVRAGYVLVAIDRWSVRGKPLSDTSDHLPRAQGGQATLHLEDSAGQAHDAVVRCGQRISDSYYRSAGLTPFIYLVAVMLSVGMPALFLVPAAVLLFARRRGEAIPSLFSLAFLGLAVSVLGGSDGLIAWRIPEMARNAINTFAWSALLLAVATFPDGRFQPRWTRLLLFTFPVLILADLMLPSWFGNAAGVVLLIAAAAALIVRSRQVGPGLERQQLRWAFLGFVAGMVMLITIFPFFIFEYQLIAWNDRWAVWQWVSVGPLLSLSILLMPAGLMVSILRYRLYDADAVIGRSAAYGILTIGFVGLFAGSEKLAEIVGERYFEHSVGIAAGAIGAAVAAACIVPLHNRVHRWAERRFQKALIRLREGLPECLADLRDTASVEQITEVAMKRMEAGVRATRAAVMLRDGERYLAVAAHHVSEAEVEKWQSGWAARAGEEALDCDRKDPLFPMRVRLCIETADEPETIGWLLLGPRPDGSFFGKDERESLEHVAGPIARAIHMAQLRERMASTQNNQQMETEARVSALEEALVRILNQLGAIRGGPTAKVCT